MDRSALRRLLALPVLLCLAAGLLASSLPTGTDEPISSECVECPAPSGEQEEVKDVQTCLPLGLQHLSIGDLRSDPVQATNLRLLPSPQGEVLVRPPEGLL